MSGVRVPAPPPPPPTPLRLKRIEPAIRRAFHGPWSPARGGLVLVAVSGGADSTALLLGLHRLSRELGIEVAVAHLHHGLRGDAADGDLEFVRDLCRRLGVRLEHARWDCRARMRSKGWSGQDGLRRLRRAFLLGAARRISARTIATAHTADDQMETLLMRLARGTGLSGLSGMAARRGPWIRPLLEVPRADVEADLRDAGQPWREDASNADLSSGRSWIRHRVIAAWLSEDGRFAGLGRDRLAARVARALREVGEARRLLDRRARRAVVDAAPARPGQRTLDVSRLAALSDPLLRLALRAAWASLRPPRGLTVRMLDGLVGLVRRPGAGRTHLPRGWFAERERGTIRIGSPASGIEPGDPTGRPHHRLRVPGTSMLGSMELRASWVDGARARRELLRNCKGECFAAAHLEGTLELRLAETDEWFVPFGRRRPRRLGEFLKKSGIPLARRSDRVVLADARGILWVVGVRRSARAPVTPGTKKALWVRARS